MPFNTDVVKKTLIYYNTSAETSCQVDLSAPLIDTSSTGHILPWSQHRAESDLLAMLYDLADAAKARRLRNCAPRLLYQQTDTGRKLHTAWFCRVRLCPVCQWRRSLKLYGQVAQIVDAAQQQRHAAGRKPYAWVLLTLTVRNCTGQQLPQQLDALSAAWHRLIKRKEFVRAVVGWQRNLEVTRNSDRRSKDNGTYHPHYHVLLCVQPSYFTGRTYLSQAAWVQLWRSCARLNYNPSVDVRRINDAAGACAEVAKYAAKPSDYIDPSDLDASLSAVQTLDRALHKRRLVAWGGLLKQLHAELGLDDTEDGDLVHTDQQPIEDTPMVALEAYAWHPARRSYYKEVQTCTISARPHGQPAPYPPICKISMPTGNPSSAAPRGPICGPPVTGAPPAQPKPEPQTNQVCTMPVQLALTEV